MRAAAPPARCSGVAPRRAAPPPARASPPAALPPGASAVGGAWRVFGVTLPLSVDGGKDDHSVTPALLSAAAKRLGCKKLDASAVTVVRKSLDARRGRGRDGPSFAYVLDVADAALRSGPPREAQPGRLERAPPPPPPLVAASTPQPPLPGAPPRERVLVVGGGPAGLFAALRLAEAGVAVTLLERGRPVEARGRDIGALFARRVLAPDSNLCYGEGGAGTWSDGKLTTRIGRNSSRVRSVLAALVHFGAPEAILTDGKPHLGTDRLVRLLQALRARLLVLGCELRWASTVRRVELRAGRVAAVHLADGEVIPAHRCVLAVGHSARSLYEALFDEGVAITPQGCAVGFRVEHPQALVDAAQYGTALAERHVSRGAGKLPVADYRLVAPAQPASEEEAAPARRAAYSFCMCPGGQVVPTSTVESELCVNGMSFSRRQSPWANSGLVVPITPADYAPFATPGREALAGVAFQRAVERAAAVAGGGGLVAPAQRVPDFLAGTASQEPLQRCSYRLGVRAAPCHELYPPAVTKALRAALQQFETRIPGYASAQGLVIGVETRTSAPLRLERDARSFQAPGAEGLYPVGEGAGHAGGIVSAAVDGVAAAEAIIAELRGTALPEPAESGAGRWDDY
jgi:uncharacterized FAD-dependent dehydrogenase